LRIEDLRHFFCGVMLLVSAPFACGVFATVPSEEPVVDLWQLFQEAELEDPRVLAGRARSEGGAWREREAFGQLLPQLSASSTLNRTAQENDITRQTYNDERYALTLSQVIYDAQTGHNYRCYSELARQQEAEYAITQEEVTLDLIERYFTALAAEDELALVSAELRATERNLARHKSWRVVAARRRRLRRGAYAQQTGSTARYSRPGGCTSLLIRFVVRTRPVEGDAQSLGQSGF
jgi:outer membrane protein TolC